MSTRHRVAWGLGAALAATLVACGDPHAQLGEACTTGGECAVGLQCLEDRCVPACVHHIDCGDGYQCRDGDCQRVASAIGDACVREIDCGPGQACLLEASDVDGNGVLIGHCGAQAAGTVAGARCQGDQDCRNGTCVLGLCTELCQTKPDCPPALDCAEIPVAIGTTTPIFSGCLPATGVIDYPIPLAAPAASLSIPVPSIARSFALVATSPDPDLLVGATRLTAPDGRFLFLLPDTEDQFYANPIRYQLGRGVSTLLVPNTPAVSLATGIYRADVSARFPQGGIATAVPRVHVLYKVDDGATLDLHLHFLDLAEHPCAAAWGGGALDATSAPALPEVKQYLDALTTIFAAAGVTLGTISFDDRGDRADLDGIDRSQLGELLALAPSASGVDVFFVRTITPVGVAALSGGQPGPPRTAATAQSGIAVSIDTLCYRDWPGLARITAHALAAQLGLFNNREGDGHADPIPDSDASATNLMFFGDPGGVALSPGQADVLRRSPELR